MNNNFFILYMITFFAFILGAMIIDVTANKDDIKQKLCSISVYSVKDYNTCMEADIDTVIQVLDVKLNTDEVK